MLFHPFPYLLFSSPYRSFILGNLSQIGDAVSSVNPKKYHELDVQKTLKDNLSYKTLIEYPVLHVVLKDHWKEYPLKGSVTRI
ncbi:unnamed protein product [Tetraodon nigroviridis]|uniref:(spotted green pufferfish) hypothetical protein n=1 Tax=Tetraodon nigroviridis TaxID=99883 RepID=Q4RJ70_TETNG|nr:unnamed protein product [Tetraodon nigroviridis]